MKMTEAPTVELLYSYTGLTFHIDNKSRQEAVDLYKAFEFEPDAEYTIEVKRRKKRKTKDQNAYAWELIGQLARKQGITPVEVYKELIKDMYTYYIVACRTSAVPRLIENWEQNGVVGWVAEDMGECRGIEDAHNVKLYYGSSQYTKKEMANFIDLIVAECKLQDIPTATPYEIAGWE